LHGQTFKQCFIIQLVIVTELDFWVHWGYVSTSSVFLCHKLVTHVGDILAEFVISERK